MPEETPLSPALEPVQPGGQVLQHNNTDFFSPSVSPTLPAGQQQTTSTEQQLSALDVTPPHPVARWMRATPHMAPLLDEGDAYQTRPQSHQWRSDHDPASR